MKRLICRVFGHRWVYLVRIPGFSRVRWILSSESMYSSWKFGRMKKCSRCKCGEGEFR